MCNVWKIFSPGNKLKAEGVGQQTGKNDGSGDDLHEIEVFHEISILENYYDDMMITMIMIVMMTMIMIMIMVVIFIKIIMIMIIMTMIISLDQN